MKPAHAYIDELAGTAPREDVERLEGRGGQPTLKVGSVYLHSRYDAVKEAARLVESADLAEGRPVFVVGLGLGYHVAELQARGFEVAVAEPDPLVAKVALQEGLFDQSILLAVGDIDTFSGDDAFHGFAVKTPQILAHPPTARLHPEYTNALTVAVSTAGLGEQHLSVAVVGPLHGGSLPITDYLAGAFRRLGHRVLNVDNREAWELYQTVTKSVESQQASGQLGQMLTHFLSEWSYARVAEFDPEICIVMAQAPVDRTFPLRLRKAGIVTAFWYVENWRHLPYWKDIAPLYDSFFHIQPGEFDEQLEAAGCRHHAFVQTGCDPERHKPISLSSEESKHYGCDLSFAGAGYYNRLQLFKGITDYDFNLWGVNWAERVLADRLVEGEKTFTSEDFMKIVAASKVNLNLHSSTAHEGVDPACDAINPRVFEIAAAGGFQICDPCIGLDAHFDFESELPVYRDLAELRQRLDYYLAHPEERAAVAGRAQKRALDEHTYVHRAQQMLDLIFERHGARILRRGIRVQRTVGEIAGKLGQESELGRWLETLPGEILFTREAIEAVLPHYAMAKSHPERVFAYLNEVYQTAERLFKEKR